MAPQAGGERPEGFLATLPPYMSPPEEALQAAVLGFLEKWASEHDGATRPKLIHLGADNSIRDAKTAALPADVALKQWIRHRLHHRVVIEGQNVKLLAPGEAPPGPAGGPPVAPAGAWWPPPQMGHPGMGLPPN